MTTQRHSRKARWFRPALLAAVVATGAALSSLSGPARAAEITVYKSPSCGCCSQWVEHLKAHGHRVIARNTDNLDPIKKMAGVPEDLQSCHTASAEGYVIEGHVPARDIERLLSERPAARGLAVPGMPAGSPGMEGGAPDRYDVILFGADGKRRTYATY